MIKWLNCFPSADGWLDGYLNTYKKALEYHKLYKEANASLFNAEKNKQITEMETRYQAEKKQQQIVLQQTELAKKEALPFGEGLGGAVIKVRV